MAVVQYTAIVNQIRGKLNGSVFNKAKNAYTLQRKQSSPRRQTVLQLERRARFSSVQREWKLLTTGQRALASLAASLNPVRDRFGNETVLSGYNHFVKSNIIRTMARESILRDLRAVSSVPFNTVFESSVTDFATAPDGGVVVDSGAILQIDRVNPEFLTLMCYISFPMSQGVSSYNGRWFFIGAASYAAGQAPAPEIDVGFSNSVGINYPIPDPTQKVLIRIDVWFSEIAALVQRIEMQTTF